MIDANLAVALAVVAFICGMILGGFLTRRTQYQQDILLRKEITRLAEMLAEHLKE